MDVESISFHRYIRNTASDTEVHAEQEDLSSGKEYIAACKTW